MKTEKKKKNEQRHIHTCFFFSISINWRLCFGASKNCSAGGEEAAGADAEEEEDAADDEAAADEEEEAGEEEGCKYGNTFEIRLNFSASKGSAGASLVTFNSFLSP